MIEDCLVTDKWIDRWIQDRSIYHASIASYSNNITYVALRCQEEFWLSDNMKIRIYESFRCQLIPFVLTD